LLGHRRCARAWCYEKQAGFHPYEQVQAMEGRLIHHAMEWLTRRYLETRAHASRSELEKQLTDFYRVLYARGIRTAFEKKSDTIQRVADNLFPSGTMHPTVKAALEGAQHTEYELKTVKKLIRADFGGKGRLLLTGILDLVIQQSKPLTYRNTWVWEDLVDLRGRVTSTALQAASGDVEIWDYKGTRADTPYIHDYVRQLLTYAELYRERAGELPKRCVLFFVNEPDKEKQLVAIAVDETIVQHALAWTIQQVKNIRQTVLQFQQSPLTVQGGGFDDRHKPLGQKITEELKQQCTACGFRFDCDEYCAHLPRGTNNPDVDVRNVKKN